MNRIWLISLLGLLSLGLLLASDIRALAEEGEPMDLGMMEIEVDRPEPKEPPEPLGDRGPDPDRSKPNNPPPTTTRVRPVVSPPKPKPEGKYESLGRQWMLDVGPYLAAAAFPTRGPLGLQPTELVNPLQHSLKLALPSAAANIGRTVDESIHDYQLMEDHLMREFQQLESPSYWYWVFQH